MRRPARPSPPPQTPIAERLEQIRAHKGLPSLRSFWTRLAEGWDDPVSYEAVRTYHYDRDPPTAYLARVAEVFGASLEWLIAGEGPMEARSRFDYIEAAFNAKTPEEEARARRIFAAFQEGAGKGGAGGGGALPMHMDSTAIPLLLGLFRRRCLAREHAGRALSFEEEVDLAKQIGAAVVAPLDALAITWRDTSAGYFFMHEHVEAMAPVLFRALALDDPPVRSVSSYLQAAPEADDVEA